MPACGALASKMSKYVYGSCVQFIALPNEAISLGVVVFFNILFPQLGLVVYGVK